MIETADMLRVFAQYRGNSIVIPGRGGRHWVPLSDQPSRDLPLRDPAMGGHASFAFGMALALPQEKVVLFDSEGDIIMNMGALTTIAEKAPENFYHFLLDNECYATTGGQAIPNATKTAYDVIAKGAGYRAAYAYDDLEELSNDMERILSEPGPVLVAMKVYPEIESLPINARPAWVTRTRDKIIADVQQSVGVATR
ncbi:MAG: hypothetical protein J4G01_06755 [Dehalococcoidia bacterium]|nr:hypothetical protein [Dehalococcoidia bacterium]